MRLVRPQLRTAWIRGALFALVATAMSPQPAAGDPLLGDLPASPLSVTYDFYFSQLREGPSNTPVSFPDFSLQLTYPSYVTTTGVRNTPVPLPTSFGYDVNFVYTNVLGWWAFSPDAGASIDDDTGFGFDDASFLFSPVPTRVGYFTAPGTYFGKVVGNAPYTPGGPAYSIQGLATLVITETLAPVPEPTSLLLVGSGVIVLFGRYRRRRRA